MFFLVFGDVFDGVLDFDVFGSVIIFIFGGVFLGVYVGIVWGEVDFVYYGEWEVG